jgi:cytochrome o ubiquinol oxidase subunit 1
VTFTPLYVLGMLGMTRRLQHINIPDWAPWLYVSVAGVGILILGVISQVIQLVVSIRDRDKLRDVTGDPWDGRSLEWATPSPPPFFNFAVMPNVEGEEAYWGIKLRAVETQQLSPEPHYEPIEMPLNSPVGIYTAFFTSVFGFAMVWRIWWLAILAFVAAFAGFVVFAWRDVHEFHVPAHEVARVDRARRAARQALLERMAEQGALP